MRIKEVRELVLIMLRFRARRCQYCCNVIKPLAAFCGVINCNDCVYRMQMGMEPRCRAHGRAGLHHEHGSEIRR